MKGLSALLGIAMILLALRVSSVVEANPDPYREILPGVIAVASIVCLVMAAAGLLLYAISPPSNRDNLPRQTSCRWHK
ncbi:MAG: hypothetical protein HYV13_03135 [Candidatus Doudnabacteria bacterium]|nr:hypothetical protein [Candidatus Doudnabacteria bacterium]